ncbi:hypothetical protein [Legionella fallonii]|uniref:Ankyrin repeat-containing protein n=1 Tax=Legionella fallonii LLAP-10 TaxID=1212491 RepID=A0A098G8H1_9GAMM|nr:hypothetical protein [Legionella fallonii]CEG58778.1 conserved protein of unknown function [Legionella fallonii LLAP-10]
MSKNNVNTEQYSVIKNLNNYLKYHNLPIKVNEDGICHALSTLYIQYVLDGKEQEFERLLSFIAQKPPVGSDEFLEVELFSLVEKIIALQVNEGKSTRNKYSQSNSHQQLHVKGKYLQSVFQIGLETNLGNWAEIIKEINLQPNEVMRVCTLQHTIAIARDKDGVYKVYDPNNSRVSQQFESEDKMVKWLSKEAFNFSLLSLGNNTLDMNINVISNERPSDGRFPSKGDLLNKYLTPKQKMIDPNLGGGLHFAMKFDDAEAAEYILNNSETNFTNKEITDTALCAIVRDSANALGKLSEKLQKEGKMNLLKAPFLYALSLGSYRCIQELLKTTMMQEFYEQGISDSYRIMLTSAFKGMNEHLIEKVVTDVLQQHGPDVFTPEIVSELIEISIKEQNSHAINLLTRTIGDLDKKINNNEQRLEFIKKAIEHNDPLMVRALITNLKISAEELNCLHMGLSIVNKYNVEIFTTLQEKGYQFTPQALDLIESKKNQSIGILKSLGIVLIRFSEFLTNQNKIKVDGDKIDQFSSFKERYQSTIENDASVLEENCSEVRAIFLNKR